MDTPLNLADAGQGRNQAMRTALALATITGRPLRLTGLVADAPPPRSGVGPGGLAALGAVTRISGGHFSAKPGEPEASFKPREARAGDYSFDVALKRPSCAAVSLMLETVLLPLAMADGSSHVLLGGGTHVPGDPTTDELAHVLVPDWRVLGIDVTFREISPGFAPSGGGEAEAVVTGPTVIAPLEAVRAFEPLKLGLVCTLAGLPVHLAEQALAGARDRLALHGLTAEEQLRRARGATGMSLLVWAQCPGLRVGMTALGKSRGGRPEALAIEAVEALLAFLHSGAGVSAFMASCLLPVLACARGTSHLTVDQMSTRLSATARVIEAFWPGVLRIDQPRNAPIQIRVKGTDFGRLAV